jgi:hypothetical protein
MPRMEHFLPEKKTLFEARKRIEAKEKAQTQRQQSGANKNHTSGGQGLATTCIVPITFTGLHDFKIRKKIIGKGSFGQVFRGQDIRSERTGHAADTGTNKFFALKE